MRPRICAAAKLRAACSSSVSTHRRRSAAHQSGGSPLRSADRRRVRRTSHSTAREMTVARSRSRTRPSPSSSTCSIQGRRTNVRRPMRQQRLDPEDELLAALDDRWTKSSTASSFAPSGSTRTPGICELLTWIVSPSTVRQLRPPQGDVLDHALELDHRDRDRVADVVRAFDEHHQPGDHVHQDALRPRSRRRISRNETPAIAPR